jgi:hypothetical protein
VRLCPLPGPLYTVLMGYKESPVREARLRFSSMVRALFCEFLLAHGSAVRAAAGGTVDLVLPVPSSNRPGAPPLARVEGLGADVAALLPDACWAPRLLQRAGAGALGHMRPDAAAFGVDEAERSALARTRVVLLDDTYVSGARAQSAACALRLAGARATLIVPLGRVLRPDRAPAHAEFLAGLARDGIRNSTHPCLEFEKPTGRDAEDPSRSPPPAQ